MRPATDTDSTGVTFTFDDPRKFVKENCTPESTSAELYSMYWMHLHAAALEAMDACPEDMDLFESSAVQGMFRLCKQNFQLFDPVPDVCKADCIAGLLSLIHISEPTRPY